MPLLNKGEDLLANRTILELYQDQAECSLQATYLNAVPEDRNEGKEHYRALGDDVVIVLDVLGELSRHAL